MDRASLRAVITRAVLLWCLVLSSSLAIRDGARAQSHRDVLPWPANPSWQQYVEAPATRDVAPVRVLDVTGDVQNPQGLTDPSGAQLTVLTRSYQGSLGNGPDYWPEGTTASASSSFDQQSLGPGNALDGTVTSYWEDGVGGSAPSHLDITTPVPVSLPGVTLLFASDGVPIDFQVQTLDAQTDTFVTQVSVTGNSQDEIACLFPASVTTHAMRILTTRTQDLGVGQYSRVSEVYPFYSQPTHLILDYGKEIGGQPEFDVTATTGNPVLGAAYSEARQWLTYLGDMFHSSYTSDIYTVRQPGLITTSAVRGGERYEEVRLFTPGSVTLRFAGIHYTGFLGTADTYHGYFVSSDDLLNRIWYAGAYTVNLVQLPPNTPYAGSTTTLPLILDGAKRDRDVWEGDLSVSGPTLYYSSYATDYMRESLHLLGSYQYTSGFVQGVQGATTPVNTSGPLTGTVGPYSAEYSMYFVTNLADYYRYTGDLAFVQQEWPIVQQELAWNAQQVNDQGLFVTDGSDGRNWHYNDNTGALTYYNVLYYRTLLDAALLATANGHADMATAYSHQAEALKTSINANLFNGQTGAYDISTTQRGDVAEDANAFAVLYGIASLDRIPGILSTMQNRLSTPYGPMSVSSPPPDGYFQLIGPFMNSYDLWARFSANDTADAFALLRNEWGRMVESDPASTDWEVMAPNGCNWVFGNTVMMGGSSWAHGWSTGATSALSHYVLGVAPVTAGYQTYLVQPHPGNLQWAEGQAPTPRGPIVVKWGQAPPSTGFSMEVQSPVGITGTIAVPAFGPDTTVTVNGQQVWQHGQFYPVTGISGAYTDTAYIYLTGVAAGDNLFTSTPALQPGATATTTAPGPVVTATATTGPLDDSMARCDPMLRPTATDSPTGTAIPIPTNTLTSTATNASIATPTNTANTPADVATTPPVGTAPTSSSSASVPTTAIARTGIPAFPAATSPATDTATARASGTFTRLHGTLPLTLYVTPDVVFSNGPIAVRVRTVRHAHIDGMLRVTMTTLAIAGRGRHGKRAQRTVTLYGTRFRAYADMQGRATVRLRVTYQPRRPAYGDLIVSAHSARLTTTRTARVEIDPLPLTASLLPKIVFVGAKMAFTVNVRTLPHADIAIVLRIPARRTSIATPSARQHAMRIRHDVVMCQMVVRGRADSRGQFAGRVRTPCVSTGPMAAVVLVTAWLRGGSNTLRTTLAVQYRKSHN